MELLIPNLVEELRKQGENLSGQGTEYKLIRKRDGKELAGNDTFQTANISNNDNLELKPINDESPMDKNEVHVTLTNYENTIRNEMNILYNKPLKEILPILISHSEMPKKEIHAFRIMHDGKLLEENSSFKDAGIKDDDELIISPIILTYIIFLKNVQPSLCLARIPGDIPVEVLKPIILQKMGLGREGGEIIKAQHYRLIHINDQFVDNLKKGTIWLNDKDTLLKAGTIEGGIIFLLLLTGTDINIDDYNLNEIMQLARIILDTK